MTQLTVRDLGRIGYQAALDEQLRLVARAKTREADEPTLLLLEHDPPVITVGLRGENEDILQSREKIAAMGVEVFESSRGGQVTYHGPGQRVVYTMLDLKKRGGDVRQFVRDLESWVIDSLAQFGVTGERREGRVGIWVELDNGQEKKIAAIGIRVRHWITFHGIAINVNPELEHFSGIVPCGIAEHGVTSLHDLGIECTMNDVDAVLKTAFIHKFIESN